MNYLLDNLELKGSDVKDFIRHVNEMASITKEMKIKAENMEMYTLCTLDKFKIPDNLVFYLLSPFYLEKFLNGEKLQLGSIPEKTFGPELTEELKNGSSGILLSVSGKKFLLSQIAISTLSYLSGVTGDMTIKRNNIIRDMHIADALYAKSPSLTFIYREKECKRKIFAVLGSTYKVIPQNCLVNILDILSRKYKTDMRSWSIDQDFTSYYLEFPEEKVGNMIPGIEVITSDTGKASFTVRIMQRYGQSEVIFDELLIKHTKNTTAETVVNEVVSYVLEKLPEIISVQEDAKGLDSEYILDYDKLDLKDDNDCGKNYQAVNDAINKYGNIFLGGEVPVKKMKEILCNLSDDIDSSKKYSVGDICSILVRMPEVSSTDPVTTCIIKRCAGKIYPYFLNA